MWCLTLCTKKVTYGSLTIKSNTEMEEEKMKGL